MEIVTSVVSYSILVNGLPSEHFCAKKGLRQGHPLSPFLFSLSMKHLSRCLNEFNNDPKLNYHPIYEKINITDLMFSDSLFLFITASANSINVMFKAFTKFSETCEEASSVENINLYICGVNDDIARELAGIV